MTETEKKDVNSNASEASSTKPPKKIKLSKLAIALLAILGMLVLFGGYSGYGVLTGNWIVVEDPYEAISDAMSGDEDGGSDGANGGGTFVESSDPTTTGSLGAMWPEDVPGSVPEFDQGEIGSSYTVDLHIGSGWSMVYSDISSDPIAPYKADLEAIGWEVQTAALSVDGEREDGGDVVGLNATKDGMVVDVVCSQNMDSCHVVVTEGGE